MAKVLSRKSAVLDIEIEKGSTFRHVLTWKSGPKGSEVEVDLTGASAQMQIRSTLSSPDVLFELNSSTTPPGLELGGTAGTIALYISHTDTSSFTWKKGIYSLEVTLANGDVRTLIRGNVTAFDEATR